MADTPTEQLLLAFGIDMTPLKEAVKGAASLLDSLNKQAAQTDAQTKDALNTAKLQAATAKSQAESAVAAAKQAILAEQLKAAEAKTTTAQLQAQGLAQKNNVAESRAAILASQQKKAEIVAENEELKKQQQHLKNISLELKNQIAEIRKKTLEERAERGAEGHEGGVGGLVEKVTGGLLGKGIAGSVAGGLLAGSGIVAVIEGAGAALEHFVEKLKEVSIESGNLVALEQVFEGLAKGKGKDAAEMMNKLSEASEGLVTKLTLLKTATAALRSPYKITSEQVEQLTHDVTILAEASGHTAEQGIKRLETALERGRPITLSTVTGLAGLRDIMRNIPPVLNPVERSTLMWARAMKLLHEQSESIGDLPDTFEKMSTRLKIASQNTMLAFGQAFNQAPGIQAFFKQMGGINQMFEKMQGFATRAGTFIGNVFAAIVPVVGTVVSVIKNLWGIITDTFEVFGKLLGLPEVKMSGFEIALRILGDGILEVGTAINAVLVTVRALVETFGSLGKIVPDILTMMALIGSGDYLAAAKFAANDFKQDLKAIPGELKKAWVDNFKDFGKETKEAFNRFDSSMQEAFEGKPKKIKTVIPPSGDTEETMGERNRKARDKMQLAMAENKEMFDLEMDAIQKRKQAEEEAYRTGQESLTEHYQAQKEIIQDSLNVQLELQRKNFEAQKDQLNDRLKHGLIKEDDYATELLTLQRKRADQEIKAEQNTYKQLFALRAQMHADEIAEQQRHVQQVAQNQQAEIHSMMQFNERGVQGGGTSVDEYYEKQLGYINQIKDVEIKKAYDLLALQKDSQANRENALKSVDAAINAAEQQVEVLIEKVASLRTKSIENLYQPSQKILEQQFQYGQEQYEAGVTNAPPEAALKNLLANITDYRAALEKELNQQLMDAQNTGVALNRDLWGQVLEKLEATYETQQKYTAELLKMPDILDHAAQMFGEIGKQISAIWTGKSMQNIGSVLQEAVGGRDQMQQDVYKAATAFGIKAPTAAIQKDAATLALEQRARDLFDPLKQSSALLQGNWQQLHSTAGMLVGDFTSLHSVIQSLVTGKPLPEEAPPTVVGPSGQPVSIGAEQQQTVSLPSKDAGSGGGGQTNSIQDKIGGFITGITAATSALGGFVATINHATSASSGALGGGISGEGLGQSIGGLFGPLGGIIGGAAGAAGGAIVGAITGNKNNQIAENIKHLQESFQNIMAEYNQNTNNLEIAIQQMQGLIQQAAELKANSKKGGEQYQQLIDEYTKELQTLENQQIKIIQNMQNALAILMTPIEGQSYLNDFKSILDQYKQFVGAAQNAKELAQANEFLSLSLQKLSSGYEQNLLGDETQAVQDALQLNQLYQQRMDLINGLNNQIQGILQQGSLTRQQTMAQKKGQQIEQLQAQTNKQLDQLNQEIAVTQMKVNAEGQIFKLASTRIGLETQLLQLQSAQTKYQMAQISALQQLVDTLQSGNYNFTTLQSLLAALGYPNAAATAATDTTQYGGNYTGGVPAPTPNPPDPRLPGGDYASKTARYDSSTTLTTNSQDATSSLETLFASAYGDRGALGYSSFRGQGL